MKAKQVLAIASILSASALSSPALATESLRYNFLNAEYAVIKIDDSELDVDGVGADVVYSPVDQLFLTAAYARTESDEFNSASVGPNATIISSAYSAGIGGWLPLSETVHLIGQLRYVWTEAERKGPFGSDKFDDSGAGVTGGVRARIASKAEIAAGVTYSDISETFSLSTNAILDVTDTFAVQAGFGLGEDSKIYTVGLRLYW